MNDINSQDWYDLTHAKRIKDVYPNVTDIHVRLIRRYYSPLMSNDESETTYILGNEERLHLSISCLNPDCTHKFILTNELIDSLNSGLLKEGRLLCKGKESGSKSAYSCLGELEYCIEPSFH